MAYRHTGSPGDNNNNNNNNNVLIKNVLNCNDNNNERMLFCTTRTQAETAAFSQIL